MPSAATVTLLIATAACAAGAAVTVAMWRQRRRAARARRLRHPSTPPPVTIALDGTDAELRWRLEVAQEAPPTGIDIVSWRPATASAPWIAEAIVQPIEIKPGGWALTPSELPPADAYEVVVAWTCHTDAGELQGSRTFRIDGRPTPRHAAQMAPPARSPLGWPLAEMALAAILIVAVIVVAIIWATGDGFDDSDAADGSPATSVPETAPTNGAAPADSVAPTSTSPATVPTTTATTTVTTVPPTSAPSTTTAPAPTTAPPPDGPSIDVVASIDACSAGPNCLVVGFTVTGFDTAPATYTCEFADGDRIDFGFSGDAVARACATGSADAGITVEIDGVRSQTVTRDDAG